MYLQIKLHVFFMDIFNQGKIASSGLLLSESKLYASYPLDNNQNKLFLRVKKVQQCNLFIVVKQHKLMHIIFKRYGVTGACVILAFLWQLECNLCDQKNLEMELYNL